MIKLENLTMSYTLGEEQVNVLSGVDLEIGSGETVAIIGPSGSGKTTLLLLLAGLEQPLSGQISLGGLALAGLDADQLADLRRDKPGIIFQSSQLERT